MDSGELSKLQKVLTVTLHYIITD